MGKQYTFIGDILNIATGSYELIPGYILKKSDNECQDKINSKLKGLGVSDYHISRYEFNSESCQSNYWIIESEEQPKNISFWQALNICSHDLTPLIEIYSSSHSFNGQRLYNFLEYYQGIYESIDYSESELKNFRDTYTAVKHFNDKLRFEYPDIEKSIHDFEYMKTLSKASQFRIIGLFSVLEFLLTNKTNKDSSINHQLKTKLNLINNRSSNKLLINNFFENVPNTVSYEKVVHLLYKYRSDVAHGNQIDFINELQILNNHFNAEDFLFRLVKNTLIQAITEPELIRDLKNC